jgi:uncharacterized protein
VIVLDTTVLVYAVGNEHPWRAACRRIVDAIGDREVTATTTVEVIQEFLHVRSRRRPRSDAAAIASRFAAMLSPLVHPGDNDLRRGLDVFTSSPSLGALDSVLAATVMNAPHLTALVSTDRGFSSVGGLVVLTPDSAGLIGGR